MDNYSKNLAAAMTAHMNIGGTDIHQMKKDEPLAEIPKSENKENDHMAKPELEYEDKS